MITNNSLFINKELYEFNKLGFCKDGEDENEKYSMCVREVVPTLHLTPNLSVDSVYVFEKQYYQPSIDSSTHWFFISAAQNILVKKETRDKAGNILFKEELFNITKK